MKVQRWFLYVLAALLCVMIVGLSVHSATAGADGHTDTCPLCQWMDMYREVMQALILLLGVLVLRTLLLRRAWRETENWIQPQGTETLVSLKVKLLN